MKITIYELLGLIKDGKAPKQIEYNCETYIYEDEIYDYENVNKSFSLFSFYVVPPILNDEVEIIEENKKIEKCKGYECFECLDDYIEHLRHKIDELIEEIEKLKGKSE